MLHLTKSLSAWKSTDFKDILKDEIQHIDVQLLPLQQGLSQSNYACFDDFSVVILHVSEETHFIRVKSAIFYSGIIAGCNCADDPGPINKLTEYCEVQFDINKETAETSLRLLTESIE